METSGNRKIIIRVDPELAEIVPGYLKNRHADIDAVTTALAANDFLTIQTLAHGMKGSGGGYGFDGITVIGADMEQAAKSKDVPQIKKGITELSVYLEQLELIYES